MNPVIERPTAEAMIWGLAIGEALAARVAGMTVEQAKAVAVYRPGDALRIGTVTIQALIAADVIMREGRFDEEALATEYTLWADADPPDADPALVSFLQGAQGAADLRARAAALHGRVGTSNDARGVGRAIALAILLPSLLEATTDARLDAALTHHDPTVGAFAAGVAATIDAIARGAADPLADVHDEIRGSEPLEGAVALARARDFRAIGDLCAGPRGDTCEATFAVALAAALYSPGWDQGMGWALSLGGAAPERCALLGALFAVRDAATVPMSIGDYLLGQTWVGLIADRIALGEG